MILKKIGATLLLTGLLGCAEKPVQQTEESVVLNGHAIAIVKQGDELYKIGNISVDKQARTFEVTGKFLRNEPPIEFLAVAKDGKRGYESLLEFDVNVYEFNLACILIGLDTHKGLPPMYHFDPKPVRGDAVEISLSWLSNGKEEQVKASEFFSIDDQKLPEADWVYTGSSFTANGKYRPEQGGGTLVGFVHDPDSIIENGQGFGAKAYRELKLNQHSLPAVGTPFKASFSYVGNTEQAP